MNTDKLFSDFMQATQSRIEMELFPPMPTVHLVRLGSSVLGAFKDLDMALRVAKLVDARAYVETMVLG